MLKRHLNQLTNHGNTRKAISGNLSSGATACSEEEDIIQRSSALVDRSFVTH